MCQACVDEGVLSQDTYDKIEAFLQEHPDAEWGPAHIVLSDDNVFDDSIRWCLGLAKAALSRNKDDLWKPEEDVEFMDTMDWYRGESKTSLRATVAFLEELLSISEDIR